MRNIATVFIFMLSAAETLFGQAEYRSVPLIHNWEKYYGRTILFLGLDPANHPSLAAAMDTLDDIYASPISIYLAAKGYGQIADTVRERYRRMEMKGMLGYSSAQNYLEALYILEAPSIHQMLLDYVDSLDSRAGDVPGRIGGIKFGLCLLANLGDYSLYDLFDSLSNAVLNDSLVGRLDSYGLMEEYAKQPGLKDRVYELTRRMLKSKCTPRRSEALRLLHKFRLMPDRQSLYREVAANDLSPVLRTEALRTLVHVYQDQAVIPLYEQILIENGGDMGLFGLLDDVQDLDSPYTLDLLNRLKEKIGNRVFADSNIVSRDSPVRESLESLIAGSTAHRYLVENGWTYGKIISQDIENYVPPKMSDYTAAQSIDSLSSHTTQVFHLNWIGDRNFVRELEHHLENAGKHLAEGDSLEAAKQVETFQDKVDKEYTRTGKSRDKRFVTPEGWKFLYHEAGYIIERLTDVPGKQEG